MHHYRLAVAVPWLLPTPLRGDAVFKVFEGKLPTHPSGTFTHVGTSFAGASESWREGSGSPHHLFEAFRCYTKSLALKLLRIDQTLDCGF
jgi:hypothetical protein